MKEFASLEEMFADIAARVEAGKKAAENHPIKVKDLRHGDHFAYHHPIHDIYIFGEVIETTEYPEDNESIASARANGFVYAGATRCCVRKGSSGIPTSPTSRTRSTSPCSSVLVQTAFTT